MTVDHGMDPGDVLRHLLAPVAPATFLDDHWGTRPLYVPGTAGKFAGLFDRDRFERAIRRGVEAGPPHFRLNAIVPADDDEPLTLMTTEPIGVADVDAALAAGMTVCVNDISAGDDALGAVAAAVKETLAYIGEVHFNCYLSNDRSGADTHFDAQVTTTLQIEGRKRWRYAERPWVPWPLANGQLNDDGTVTWMGYWPDDLEEEPVDPATFSEVVLEPGDLLYLPAGTWHEAKAVGGSLALNLSFGSSRFFPLLTALLQGPFLERPGWRAPPPPVLIEGTPEVVPEPVANYVATRIGELRAFLAELDPRGPEVLDAWRTLTGR